jgi:hypothetical protein
VYVGFKLDLFSVVLFAFVNDVLIYKIMLLLVRVHVHVLGN